MLSLKSITETLATLGGGALILAGCGGAPEAAEVPEQPTAASKDGASGSCSAGSCGGAAHADAAKEGDKPADAAAAPPTDAAQPTATETVAAPAEAAGTGGTKPAAAPAGTGTSKTAAPPAKKPGNTAGAGKPADKKKGAAGSCGEGTCG